MAESKQNISDVVRLFEPALIGFAFWRQKDTFRLAIMGDAVIEQALSEGVKGALAQDVAKELFKLPFWLKLELARGLGIVTPETVGLARKLREIRNDFAHWKIQELELERARELIGPIRAIANTSSDLVDHSNEARLTAHQILQVAFVAALIALRKSIAEAARERARRDAALEQAVRGTLGGSALEALIDASLDERSLDDDGSGL